jgi:hypothetical protein
MTQTRRDFFLKFYLADDETNNNDVDVRNGCKQFQGKVRAT